MLTIKANKVFQGTRLVKECASHNEAVLYRQAIFTQLLAKRRERAAMIDPEDSPNLLAGAVDSCVDTAIMLINENDPTALPAWAQQVCSLVVAADAAVDELLKAMGVPDPDDTDD